MFYCLIKLRSVYIQCYLEGGAEFEAAINHITVDFRSSSLIPSPQPSLPHRLKSSPIARNRPPRCPSPPLRDVGPGIPPSQPRQQRRRPVPFQTEWAA